MKYLLKLTIHGSNITTIVSTFIPLINLNHKWFSRYSNLNYLSINALNWSISGKEYQLS